MLTSVNPATGETVATYEPHTPDEAATAVETAHARHTEWRRLTFDQRAPILRAAADRLEARREELARLMAVEMGKPVGAGRSEVDKCAWVCRHYADHAEAMLADVDYDADRDRSYLHHEPLGVVLAVMPWNFPLWQVFRPAAPALMAGNGMVLKHASNVTGCSLAIEEIFRDAGLPDGLFRSLKIGSDAVESVIGHDLVRAVTLTGSVPAGAAVASVAGRMLKKSVLELGGSDAYVVLDDAEFDHTVETCVKSRLVNAGQSCIAAKRLIVTQKNESKFINSLRRSLELKIMGDPMDDVDIGPMVSIEARNEVHDQVPALHILAR